MIGYSSLASLPRLRDYTSHRASSHDRTGGNRDFFRIGGGERRILAEMEGPGYIKHIWMTLGMPGEDYLRRHHPSHAIALQGGFGESSISG